MANYRNSDFVTEVSESVLDQTLDDWEIILVDGGSRDYFEEVVKQSKRREGLWRLAQFG